MTFQCDESVIDFLALPAPHLICRSFLLLLGRAPSPSEQNSRERALHLGRGRIAMLADIYQSLEANGYRHTQREQGSDAQFIKKLYQRYLGRPVDPDGLAHYMKLIEHKDRAEIEADVAASSEGGDCRSFLHEVKQLMAIYHRSQQWWRWFGRSRCNWQIKNIESEVSILIACRASRKQDKVLQAIEAMREQVFRQIETTRVIVRQDIARTREDGLADVRTMIARSNAALENVVAVHREQSEQAFASLAVREAKLRVELDQARIEMHDALALIRDDAQSRFDRLLERQLAERTAAEPSIQKVDTTQLAPHARHILHRMQTLNDNGRQA